jgi:hypothetical protein
VYSLQIPWLAVVKKVEEALYHHAYLQKQHNICKAGGRVMEKSIVWRLTIVILSGCFGVLSFTGVGATEFQLPPMPPTIDDVTEGKVKIGDTITKDNLDLIKEYIPSGLEECVNQGLVMKMGTMVSPEKIQPRTYLEYSERYRGQAVVNDRIVVRLKDGSEWPGGIPFLEPKTAWEVMGNKKFGLANDNYYVKVQPIYYVNKSGKHYKTANMRIINYWTDGRKKVPPLGSVPGQEKYHQRFINVFMSPHELKGLGQFNINHDDDTEHYDIGFLYLPAFKRTIRISVTTFQDNVGGSDFTFGDPEGLREPFGSWNFKLIGKKNMLVTEPIRDPQPLLTEGGLNVDPNVEWDEGKRFARLGWANTPVYIVEATSKEKGHVYSKKTIHVIVPYFSHSNGGTSCAYVDIYARTGELWKCYYDWRGQTYTHSDGEHYTATTGFSMHDLQTAHQTHFINYTDQIDEPMAPEYITLKLLLQLGR